MVDEDRRGARGLSGDLLLHRLQARSFPPETVGLVSLPEEAVGIHVPLFPVAMKNLDPRQSAGVARTQLRFLLRDSVHQSEHHPSLVGRREHGVAQDFVGR